MRSATVAASAARRLLPLLLLATAAGFLFLHFNLPDHSGSVTDAEITGEGGDTAGFVNNMDGQSDQTDAEEDKTSSSPQSRTREKIWEMEDRLIMAKAYLQFAPPHSNSHLVKELKLRIKELDRVLSQSIRRPRVSQSALQKLRAMEGTLSKAQRAYPDCSAMASKLCAMTYNTEEQLKAQQSEASYLMQVASRTLPKGHHCLGMRLTSEYFMLEPHEQELPKRDSINDADMRHYAIFSDNVLACAVVVNSTISVAKDPGKIVFHLVTNSLNLPSIKMWFLLNPPSPATIQIESLDDFKWLPADFCSMFEQKGLDPRYTSALNHLRFYLPEVFPSLNKIVLLDHDVVVQRDLSGLWDIDMKGKVNGAVSVCDFSLQLKDLLNFSAPVILSKFDAKACIWAFGMNVFDLKEWRRLGLTTAYHNWLEVGQHGRLWKAGSLPLGQVLFYNHTMPLDRWWHMLGLGYDRSLGSKELERAAVIHYSGNLKPWLEISIPKYRHYWNKFLNYDSSYFQQCNIHK